jgi:hypothetical protein
MDNEDARRRFISELWQRFEQLQAWAVENWPDQEHPCRARILSSHARRYWDCAVRRRRPGQPVDREPEQGGAQYVDLNPAPWP